MTAWRVSCCIVCTFVGTPGATGKPQVATVCIATYCIITADGVVHSSVYQPRTTVTGQWKWATLNLLHVIIGIAYMYGDWLKQLLHVHIYEMDYTYKSMTIEQPTVHKLKFTIKWWNVLFRLFRSCCRICTVYAFESVHSSRQCAVSFLLVLGVIGCQTTVTVLSVILSLVLTLALFTSGLYICTYTIYHTQLIIQCKLESPWYHWLAWQ